MKIFKSNFLAFLLGIAIIFVTFAVSDADTGSIVVSGTGLILWVAFWAFRWGTEKDE